MKPNFALSLSLDGIRLLHRGAGGWHVVGEVDLQSPSLGSELAMLRRTAASLEPGGVRSKVVIPNSQIRYLTLETPGLDTETRRKAAQAALDGATPYAVDDLVFDISLDGDLTHVAAVALETLEEAEAFATEHRFQPISFVAVPDAGDFIGEPHFGPTSAASEISNVPHDSQSDTVAVRTPGQTARLPLPPAPKDAVPDTSPVLAFSTRRKQLDEPTAPPLIDDDEPKVPVAGYAETTEIAPPPPNLKPPAHTPKPAFAPAAALPGSGAASLSMHGAPEARRGSGRRLLILMVLLMLFLAGLAAWASTTLGPGLAGLWRTPEPEVTAEVPAQFVPPTTPIAPSEPVPAPEAEVEQVSLETGLTDEDAAVLDALRAPALAEPDPPTELTDDERRAAYAVTGIWPIAPEVPAPSPSIDLEDLYVPSIDPVNLSFDAVALPEISSEDHELVFQPPTSPAAAGTQFVLDERGLVAPSAEGTLNPDGVLVFAGPPPVRPPATLARVEEPGENPVVRAALAGIRPQTRPTDLIETTERATLDGLTRSELAQLRPRLRPASAQETAQQAAVAAAVASASLVPSDATPAAPLSDQGSDAALATATDLAVAESLRPGARPKNFGAIVERATAEEAEEEAAEEEAPVQVASVAPRSVVPNIPSSASVSREATERNAINLRQVNLIGVYGKPSNRRALVRLPNGRFQKVQVGDKIDGGRISAIGDSELRYQKGNRNLVLKMP